MSKVTGIAMALLMSGSGFAATSIPSPVRAFVRKVDQTFDVAGVINGGRPFTRRDRQVTIELAGADGRALASRVVTAKPVPVTTRFRATRQARFHVRVPAATGADHVTVRN